MCVWSSDRVTRVCVELPCLHLRGVGNGLNYLQLSLGNSWERQLNKLARCNVQLMQEEERARGTFLDGEEG